MLNLIKGDLKITHVLVIIDYILIILFMNSIWRDLIGSWGILIIRFHMILQDLSKILARSKQDLGKI